jgi:hypothetical protein
MPSMSEYNEGLENLAKHNNEVDIIVTHTCSDRMLVELKPFMVGFFDPDYDMLTNYLDIIEEEVKFKFWYIGHMHIDLPIDEKHFFVYNNIRKVE